MNPYRMAPPPKWWPPKLSPALVRLMRPIRTRRRLREQRLMEVTVHGAERVREAVDSGQGVLITPNHASHADPFTMYEAADRVGTAFYFMATWHVFDSQGVIGQWVLQRHGVFSIDREGADLQAFKQAVQIVREELHPLVILPEGEVYHCSDRVTPFREGAAAVALAAAKRAKRSVVCFPCALKYTYVDDPTEELLRIMERLERQIHWRPRPDRSLEDRIYAFGEAMMAIKELEFLGRVSEGSLPDRTEALANEILRRLEERNGSRPRGSTIPERVKELRHAILEELQEVEADDPKHRQLHDELDDVFLVVQLFSYPGDYVKERPSVERLAETLDKFEEDVLGVYSATVRATRQVTVHFGEPVPVPADQRSKGAARQLTDALENGVQEILDAHGTPKNDAPPDE